MAIKYSVILNKSSAISDDQIVYISNTAFTDNLVIRYSIKGYLFKLFNRPIDWRLIKQKTIITSNTEIELLALSYAAKNIIW